MTLLMTFGLVMTIACLLTYKLRSRIWRKWLGLAMAVSGAIAVFKFSWSSGPAFITALMTMLTGWELFSDRDQFTQEEE